MGRVSEFWSRLGMLREGVKSLETEAVWKSPVPEQTRGHLRVGALSTGGVELGVTYVEFQLQCPREARALLSKEQARDLGAFLLRWSAD